MKDIIIQAIGAVGYSLLALSYFKKVKKQILLMQIFAYIFFVIHYYLLNGITGAVCNSIGLFALISIYLFDKYNLKNKTITVGLFIILLLIANIITFQNMYSIFPLVASTIVLISFIDNNENNIRIVGIIAAICWLIYAIVYKSYVAIAFEVVTLIDICVAYINSISKK
jgi:hypothetical protein